MVREVVLLSQSGESQFVSLDENLTLRGSICQHLMMTEKEFAQRHFIVAEGLRVDSMFPMELSAGTLLLLNKHRKDMQIVPPVEGPLDLEAMIQERMKKYAAPDVEITLDEEKVSMLMDMGFTRERVQKALILTYSDAEEALNWLLEHSDDPTADIPLTQKEVGSSSCFFFPLTDQNSSEPLSGQKSPLCPRRPISRSSWRLVSPETRQCRPSSSAKTLLNVQWLG
jgi:hypothetical protein